MVDENTIEFGNRGPVGMNIKKMFSSYNGFLYDANTDYRKDRNSIGLLNQSKWD